MKVCRYCERYLALPAFTKRAASPDGLSYKCRDCASAYAKIAYAADAIRAKDRAAQWARENRDRRRAIVRAWDDANREQKRAAGRERCRAQRIADPKQARLAGVIAAQRRRHRMAAADGAPTRTVVERMLRIARGRCTYCLGVFAKLTIDHFHPVSKGGSGAWWNLAPCCATCNSSKRDADGPAWIERRFGIKRVVEVIWLMESLSAARLP